MVLSKRERNIAIGTVTAVVLFVLYQAIYMPYEGRLEKVQAQTANVRTEIDRAQDLFKEQQKLQPDWTAIQKGGLKTDASQAESQLQHELLNAAQQSGVSVVGTRPERSTSDKNFQVLNYSATGNGTMAAIARLLYIVERSKIPLRVNEVQVTPRREGTDDLQVRLSVSTLRMIAEDKSASKK